MIRERTDCRLCNGPLKPVFKLSPSPIANSFPLEPDEAAERYPLEMMQCNDCEHVQLKHVISGLFTDYKYETPVTPHLEESAKELRRRFPDTKHVLEIGSNNGAFLRALRAVGFAAFGMDPASTDEASIKDYFSEKTAHGFKIKLDLIVANNVFAHIDDLQDVFRGINLILSDSGAVVFEVQYLVELVEGGAFDMIYSEHLSYHTLAPLDCFLKRMGMVMTEFEYLDTHGGSIRVTARRQGKPVELPEEPLDWQYLRERIDSTRAILYQTVQHVQPIVAFGASAKACTLINELGLAPFISYVVDDTKIKQGRYIPGTGLLIKPVSELKDETVIMLAWNYAQEIRARLPLHRLIHPFNESFDGRPVKATFGNTGLWNQGIREAG